MGVRNHIRTEFIQTSSTRIPTCRHNQTYIIRMYPFCNIHKVLIYGNGSSISTSIHNLIRRIAYYRIEFHIVIVISFPERASLCHLFNEVLGFVLDLVD